MSKGFGLLYPIVVLCVLAVLGSVGFAIAQKNQALAPVENESIVSVFSPTNNSPTPVPTPFPFQELTIPYLRNREYASELAELSEVSENSLYTSYLTSYDSDGFRVDGLLTIPQGNAPEGGWPAIVFVHGYIPPTVYRTTVNYESYVDYLARNGFVVFKIDLRGHANSEGIPMGAYYAGDYIIDTLSAYSALQKADFVNPEKIGLWGHSMGGNVTFRSFVAKQDIPALVIWAGAVYSYTDMQKYGIDDNSYRPPTDNSAREEYRRKLREAHGDFDANSEFWKQVAPTNYLEGVKGAVQIQHAVDDAVVNIGYSRDLMHILDRTAIPHQLQEYPVGGHNISGSSFTRAMQSTVQFFNQYLQSR
jgi:uncharacterized protein